MAQLPEEPEDTVAIWTEGEGILKWPLLSVPSIPCPLSVPQHLIEFASVVAHENLAPDEID